jgi:DNA-binding response OmpR family regulator
MNSVLIIEDDPLIYVATKDWLVVDGYETEVATSGESALVRLQERSFDLLLVDVVLPGINGFEVCSQYRKAGGQARILIVSGRKSIDDKLQGLEAGADDYIAKPFDVREVAARFKVLMRRALLKPENRISFEDVELDIAAHKAYREGKELLLGPLEFSLLELMLRSPNQLFTAEDLLKSIWKGKGSIDSVRTSIKTLRKRLELPGQPQYIKTIHGLGYSFTNEW